MSLFCQLIITQKVSYEWQRCDLVILYSAMVPSWCCVKGLQPKRIACYTHNMQTWCQMSSYCYWAVCDSVRLHCYFMSNDGMAMGNNIVYDLIVQKQVLTYDPWGAESGWELQIERWHSTQFLFRVLAGYVCLWVCPSCGKKLPHKQMPPLHKNDTPKNLFRKNPFSSWLAAP